MQVDVNTFLGSYPFRDIGEFGTTDLLREMLRTGSNEAWISHVAAVYWRDPGAGNAALISAQARDPRLRPVLAVHPGLPGWTGILDEALRRNAPAVRADPGFYGIPQSGGEMRSLVAECGLRGLPLMMTTRLEDLRQRHPHDASADLAASSVRDLIRSDARIRLLITHADRDFIEQVHFGSTPDEAMRILWDISWIWGPPEDHLELLLQTVGLERFTFGTGMPLRLPDTALAKIDLLNLAPTDRDAIASGNLRRFLGHLNTAT